MYFPNYRPPQVFDPSQLGDPIALKTEWGRGKLSGANFCTSKLVASGSDKMVFRPTMGALIFDFIFIIAGVGLLILTQFSSLMPVLLGLVFAGLGLYLLYSGSRLFVFDKNEGICYKGRKPTQTSGQENIVRLQDIHALQLTSSYHTGRNSYYSYELCLVLESADRVEVVCHGGRKRIRRDAQTLSEFLSRPVWDAI